MRNKEQRDSGEARFLVAAGAAIVGIFAVAGFVAIKHESEREPADLDTCYDGFRSPIELEADYEEAILKTLTGLALTEEGSDSSVGDIQLDDHSELVRSLACIRNNGDIALRDPGLEVLEDAGYSADHLPPVIALAVTNN